MLFYVMYRWKKYTDILLVCNWEYTRVEIKMKDWTTTYTDTNSAQVIFY